ncbi:hypothetical protein CR51_35915 [Caballeronia megalochromosomata]|nr:hypothetical protein CR51_35915 [Caballeronia megalochromosomata]
MTGTGAVAIAVAAAIPGLLLKRFVSGGRSSIRFKHPSGSREVGAEVVRTGDNCQVTHAVMSRSASWLMEGTVYVPFWPSAAKRRFCRSIEALSCRLELASVDGAFAFA